jgi:D-alanyl-D-alanine carboxypeptidase
MKETFYINPHGLDSSFKLEAYSTADDLAILTKALIED